MIKQLTPSSFSLPLPWKKVLRQNITQLNDLIEFLQLSTTTIELIDPNPDFILNVPRRLAEKIAKNDPSDPLFIQFVPLKKAREHAAGFSQDPVADVSFIRQSKLLHKYDTRALVITTGACAMHCRYCFRQNFSYETERTGFENELQTLQMDTSIEEVILSGGDPLSLSDNSLATLLDDLSQIRHLKRIRFHTRFPIGIPERIDDEFLSILKNCPKQIWFVIHANHPNEFDNDVWKALKRVQCLGIPLLNQSVLLKGVNDNSQTLQMLCQMLVDHGVLPYYLHQLDKVTGAHAFDVSVETGQQIIKELTETMSGYAVPKYVQEVAGKPSKTSLTI